MSCIHCEKETDEKYVIDPSGDRYCSEECLEEYMDKHDISFDPHPYEDTYLMLRNSYIELLESWEPMFSKTVRRLENAVDELFEEMDELIDDHAGFIRAEGDDGSYAWEIYQYTLKLRELQKRVFAWRPNRKMLYWVTGSDANYGSLDKNEEEIYDKVCTALYLTGYEDFILYVIKHHQHPCHWGLNYVFDNMEMAKEAYETLKQVCGNYGVDISILESHKCEAHCGDILEADADTYINGWFYCYSCKESGDHGIFRLQELEVEFRYYEEHEEERQVVIYERRDWCVPFKRKAKRSCRNFGVEVPAWAE
ncbi:hypothetical protein SAMN03159341_101443 [Paenibacillus sp. 1_12]|uniref:hypothetical protein n=1 Tax=Paenibacillus sp. 1_12 TaxID=1566278 RepID=UPI0008EBCF55|nr:hypothetical protein [Paenibacillus sp. 1_12]SFK75902.1 hypothetical protein SAMN03159341_101443 [Paenibacillus sp. 1_12]